MRIGNSGIEFEETEERMKVEIPLQRSKLAMFTYSLLALIWLGGLILFIVILFRPSSSGLISGLPRSIQITWFIGVLLWIYVWIRYVGRSVLRWWQFYLAKRELLFISEHTVIVRRPVSLLGLTDAYDRRYMSPFYFSDQHQALAFPYGNVRHILVAMSVAKAEQMELMKFLNGRFFPQVDDDDDDDED